MTKAKKYWKGLAELTNDPAIESLKHNEFAEKLNGRVAMLGVIAAIGAYATTGQLIPGIF